MKLSIVIPTLNEQTHLLATLAPLQMLRCDGHELIVVDGGSSDDTVAIAHAHADRVIASERGRARQMNAGAALASGEVLLFLHADTFLPENSVALIHEGLLRDNKSWGRFDVRLSGHHPLLRVVERLMNWRSRLTGIATGDQAIFVRHATFSEIGGYQDIPLMEDVALCKALKHTGRPLNLSAQVLTSSRRWEQHGVLRTIVMMWHLRLAYSLGADPRHLAELYQRTCNSPPRAS